MSIMLDNLPELLTQFNTCIGDLSNQNSQILQITRQFQNGLLNSNKKVKLSSAPIKCIQDQDEVELLKDELRMYKNFNTNFEQIVDTLHQSHQSQIDKIKQKLIENKSLEKEYLSIVDSQNDEIEELKSKLLRQEIQITKDQQQIDALIYELSQKNKLLELREIIMTPQQQPQQQSNTMNQRLLAKVQCLKQSVKKLTSLNRLLQQPMSSQVDSEWWVCRVEQLQNQVESKQKMIFRLQSKLQSQTKVPKQSRPSPPTQKLDGEIFLRLLEENQRLRMEVKELKFKDELQSALNNSIEQKTSQLDISMDENDINYIRSNWNKIERFILLSKFHEVDI